VVAVSMQVGVSTKFTKFLRIIRCLRILRPISKFARYESLAMAFHGLSHRRSK
jgi:hypothetical protein